MFSSKSSSFHKINADKGLGLFSKISWFVINFVVNHFFPNRSGDLVKVDFSPKLNKGDWKDLNLNNSPSRILSDLFWKKIDWDSVGSELNSINIFDIGTGDGKYALKLSQYSGGVKSYFGIDVKQYDTWPLLMNNNDFITLKKIDNKALLKNMPLDTNLIISQSVIEHIEDDLLYFEQIRQYIETTRRNIVQIHLFPSASCLKIFLNHGIRQYTPRTASKISKIFRFKKTYSILFKLGGDASNKLHFKHITIPLLFHGIDSRRQSDRYSKLLQSAIQMDFNSTSSEHSFYALVIHSNFKIPIFKDMDSLIRAKKY